MISTVHVKNNKGHSSNVRLISISEVMRKTGMGRTWIYNAVSQGSFPIQVKIGKRSLWIEDEIDYWIGNHIANRNINLD